jgi:hypothetical protein
VQPVAPTAPPVEQIIPTLPVITVPSGTAQVQLVRGGRPDAGAGPPVMVNIERPRPDRAHARLTAAQPFNRAAVTVDVPAATARNTRLVVAEAYYDIRLTEPQTTIEVTLTVPPDQSFALQVAVSDNNGNSFGAYTSAPVADGGGGVGGTWIGPYQYGSECFNYMGRETLVLSVTNGLVSGTVADEVLSPSPGRDSGTVSGTITGSTLTLNYVYASRARAVLNGTIRENVISGRITGVCGNGAAVTLTKQ